MVFEDSPVTTTGTGSRYLGEGFRHEPDFRDGTLDGVAEVMPTGTEPAVGAAPRAPKPNLEYVFDDPAHGEPGRDRMLVHVLWELVLLLAVAGVGYLLYRAQSQAFEGPALRSLALDVVILGLLGAATAIALRAGVPNLAIGAVAVASGIYFAQHSDGGLLLPMLTVIGLCAAIGLVQGVLVTGLHVPAWAAGLGVAVALLVWIGRLTTAIRLTGGYDPRPDVYYWLGGLAAISVLTGLVCLIPSVRRGVGRFRPVADPAQRRGLVAAAIAAGATVLSSVLAGLLGIVAATDAHRVVADDGLSLTALGLGVALLGGTSAYGRRGGIFGTVFAAGLLAAVGAYAHVTGRDWNALALAAIAIGLGLAVTRLVERFGRPAGARSEDDEEEWAPRVHVDNGTAAPPPRAWQPAAPPAPPVAGGLWASDDAWGAADRR